MLRLAAALALAVVLLALPLVLPIWIDFSDSVAGEYGILFQILGFDVAFIAFVLGGVICGIAVLIIRR